MRRSAAAAAAGDGKDALDEAGLPPVPAPAPLPALVLSACEDTSHKQPR